MYILGIETTGPFCSVALINEKEVLNTKKSEDRMNHLSSLTPMINQVLKEEALSLNEIDAIAVSKGPGSFTGIRIGVSTARALGQIVGVKLIGVPTLQAFGYSLDEYEGIVCPILDARRNQVYGAAYKEYEKIVKDGPYMLDEFLGLLEETMILMPRDTEVTFIGDGVAAYRDELTRWSKAAGKKVRVMENTYQDAKAVALLGRDLLDRGIYTDYNNLKPEYMRKAEAERRLEERLKNG
ncbi:MAG: tRNA (adenosine(37)-N6)-threonylcarbamoyltransferase complex dimerization subunit type 1 TsaB [Anaerovoracaceae bacterium]